MLERWDEVLVQQYIDGREVNVGILGDTVLPIAEIDFGRMPKGMWRIVTYRSKWETGSDEDLGSVPRCPARPARPGVATSCDRSPSRRGGSSAASGYGRVDMRIDERGRPWILEVNANPTSRPTRGSRAWPASRASTTRRWCARSASSDCSASRDVAMTAERWALAAAALGRRRREIREPDLFRRGRGMSVSIRLGSLRPPRS